ncbi:MAG: apolipoprotein N-acyltransferase [Candidatus Omnitrophota bacterium]|jgi:apolipoprotein N-acyltransferase
MLRKMKSSTTLEARRAIRLKDYCFSIASAILLILSFPDFNLWIFAWFGFVPVFFALKNKTRKEAFFLFFITGIVFWAGVIYWLAHVTLAGTTLLILYLALYFAIFGLIIRSVTRRSTPYALIFIPSAWVLLEYARGCLMTGFPWALLGYSQYLNLPVIQIADITAVWGVSFLIMFVNVAIVEIIWSIRNRLMSRLKIVAFFLILILILSLGYGYYRILGIKVASQESGSVKISIIQGNIPQELKWDERYNRFALEKYLDLSRLAAKGNPQLIIWPEAAVPGIFGEDDWVYGRVFSLAKEIKIPLLVGAVVKERENYFGSALLINAAGEIAGRYDKLHLVPFGEYIPLKNIFPFLETIVPIGDIQKGKEYTIFSPGFAVLDCFEDVFPDLAREFVKKGAGFLVNITNDAWYKRSSAPYQHLQASVFRAVENRVYLARAANTGVSGFISPTGEIFSLVRDDSGKEIFVDGFATEQIFKPEWPRTFYTRYGDIFPFLCLLFIIYGKILTLKQKR